MHLKCTQSFASPHFWSQSGGKTSKNARKTARFPKKWAVFWYAGRDSFAFPPAAEIEVPASASAYSARAPVGPCGTCRRALHGGTSHTFGRLPTGRRDMPPACRTFDPSSPFLLVIIPKQREHPLGTLSVLVRRKGLGCISACGGNKGSAGEGGGARQPTGLSDLTLRVPSSVSQYQKRESILRMPSLLWDAGRDSNPRPTGS